MSVQIVPPRGFRSSPFCTQSRFGEEAAAAALLNKDDEEVEEEDCCCL